MESMETGNVLLRGAWEGAIAQEWFAGSSCFRKDGGTLDFGSFVAVHVTQSRHKHYGWQLPAAQKILSGYPNIKKRCLHNISILFCTTLVGCFFLIFPSLSYLWEALQQFCLSALLC